MSNSVYMYADRIITFGSNMPFGGIASSLDLLEWLEQGMPNRGYQSKPHPVYKGITITSKYYRSYEDLTKCRHTKDWKIQAMEFKKGKCCVKCGSDKDLQVHHFSNQNYEILTDQNCTVLCKNCHYLLHHPQSCTI